MGFAFRCGFPVLGAERHRLEAFVGRFAFSGGGFARRPFDNLRGLHRRLRAQPRQISDAGRGRWFSFITGYWGGNRRAIEGGGHVKVV